MDATQTNCPRCEAPIENAAARFCESCGCVFREDEPIAQRPAATAPLSMSCQCSQPDLGSDGFCAECGMKPAAAAQSAQESPDWSFCEIDEKLAFHSDIGLRHHVNQDAACCLRFGEWSLLAVSDGVSSSQYGERASRACADAWLARVQLSIGAGDAPEKAMAAAMRAAHAATIALPYDPGCGLDEPEATFVAAIVGPDKITIGWVGDSRAYALDSNGKGSLLTRDDSWMASAMEAGMTEAEAEADPRAHAITQCMGTRDDDPAPHVASHVLGPGQSLLLCTDGLWNYFPQAEAIGSSHAAHPTRALHACQELVARANAEGGRDNITVAIWRP